MSLSRIIMLCLSLVLFCGGCTRLPGGIAASNIPLTPGSYIPIGEVSATDCKVNLLGIIPVSGGNQLHQALDKAKRKENADALIEITVVTSGEVSGRRFSARPSNDDTALAPSPI